MLKIFKVGTKFLNNPEMGWRDGQLVDILPSGTWMSPQMRRHFTIIEDGLDYWEVRGSRDWKSKDSKVLEFKKQLCATDSNGKYAWEFGFLDDAINKRDLFIDPKHLLDTKIITLSQFEDHYNKDKEAAIIYIDIDPDIYINHELDKRRLVSDFFETPGSIAAGTYSIGAAGDYTTVTAFEADIAAQLTGNLTGEHLDEETAISSVITFNLDTNNFLLKLTAASDSEHNGIFGNATHQAGDGARVNYTSFDRIAISESSEGTLNDLELSKLVLDARGSGNIGVLISNSGENGLITVNKNIIRGDVDSTRGIDLVTTPTNYVIYSNIIYDFFDTGSHGIRSNVTFSQTSNGLIANNTVINCYNGIDTDSTSGGTQSLVNNLVQDGNVSGSDYVKGGTWSSAKNISEDATSPNAAYQSKDVHTNSVFQDYANDNFKLDSGGDVTNLAIVDDGDDLSVNFTDDIIGQTRSTWYIGASEIVAGGFTVPLAMHHLTKNIGAR
jgi:hypothetical protein